MQQLISLKKDFYRKFLNNIQEKIFVTDDSTITGYQALSFYQNIQEKIPKEVKTIAFITNQSIENLIICFFLILSKYDTIFLSNEQNKEDIFESL